MRPIKLTMQAYGSYPDKVVIPFDKLGEKNIFLVSGVTGSGKTTIFDAICFALFNKSSGSLRGNDSLRSHFASDNIPSFVEFEFLYNGEIYKIKRMPSFLRNKQRGEGTILESSKVELYLPNNKIITNSKEVDEYIIDLLGVNDFQFCQIALLAQGEFLKLLNASTQERSEIFRNIFKTKDYQLFQLKLKDEAQKYKNDYDKLKDSILQYISQVESNDNLICELKTNFIKKQIFDDLNIFIEKLEAQNNEMSLLFSDDEKSILSLNADLMKKAIICEKINQKNNLLKRQIELKKLDEKYQLEYNIAKESFEKLDVKNKILLELQNELNKLSDEYKKINELNEIKNKYNEAEKQVDILTKEFDKLLEKLSIQYYYNIFDLDNDLKFKQEEFSKFDNEVKIQTVEYEQKYHNYLASQAGILAKELKKDTPCPVCGSLCHPSPAVVPFDIVSKIELDEQKKDIELKKDKLAKISKDCALLVKEKELTQAKFDEFIKLNNIEFNLETLPEKKNLKLIDSSVVEIKKQELSELKEQKSFLSAQVDIVSKSVIINSVDEFIKAHKQKTDEYNNLTYEIKKIKENFDNKNIQKEQNLSQLLLIEKQLSDFVDISIDDYEDLQFNIANIKEQIDIIKQRCDKNNFILSLNSRLISDIKDKYKKFNDVSQKYSHYKILSDCANGSAKGKTRIAFEQYIQGYYLDMVLHEANKHLKIMTKNQFQLQRKKEALNLQSKTGLDIEVMDFHTFKTRSAKTLSGGESFKAALSLALGLSDCVSSLSGAINIDMIFIDEGFGTLDSESLDLAMDVISNLSETNKLVGIISHVEELQTRIENQIISIKTPVGSKIKLVF